MRSNEPEEFGPGDFPLWATVGICVLVGLILIGLGYPLYKAVFVLVGGIVVHYIIQLIEWLSAN